VLTVALFCTRSFDPSKLLRSLASAGADLADVDRLDVREGDLIARDAEGAESFRAPVAAFRDSALRGCDECADFSGVAADLAVGSVGSDPGRSTVLVRTEAGAAAWAEASDALDAAPFVDLAAIARTVDRNRRRAERALRRPLDPDGPLWTRYEEHLEAYAGTDRAPVHPPSHRSHHYEVSC
jgi:coenzyme F420 hydrogenase subunit beta